MTLEIDSGLLNQIHAHVEAVYPEEGAGFLMGKVHGDNRRVTGIMCLTNAREESARYNRYLLVPADYLRGEEQADRLGVTLLGVFHSHPDHPNRPSEFDRNWALPWFLYLITNVHGGQARESRVWKLSEDRSAFIEEQLIVRTREPEIGKKHA